jgi:hypothetical protein
MLNQIAIPCSFVNGRRVMPIRDPILSQGNDALNGSFVLSEARTS